MRWASSSGAVRSLPARSFHLRYLVHLRLLMPLGESRGLSSVPLGQFARDLHGVCGFALSDEELRKLTVAVQPAQGEPAAGRSIREQPLDYHALLRAMNMSAAREHSQYLRRAVHSTSGGPGGAGAWS